MIGGGRWLGLLGVSTFVLLGGCDWLFGGSTPVGAPPRPGVDKQVKASGVLPAAGTGRQYDAGIVPIDETQGSGQIGSVVQGKGGQKAQKEAADKEAAERDAKDREARQKREAEDREEKARTGAVQPAGGVVPPVGTAPPSAEPVAVPPPAPVSTTPMPPPPSGEPTPEPGQISPVPPPSDKPS